MGEVKVVHQLLDGAALFLEFHLSRLKSRNLQNIIDEHQQQIAALIDRLGKQLLVASSKSFSEASRFEKPTIEFSGVRISWLMFARTFAHIPS